MLTYCFRYFISISHSMDNVFENRHFHTLEITTYLRDRDGEVEKYDKFEDMERYASKILLTYENQYLNDCEEFEGDISIEHVGDVLYERLSRELSEYGLYVERFEIGENPLRTYIITHTL